MELRGRDAPQFFTGRKTFFAKGLAFLEEVWYTIIRKF
jgi:hypothetical protein